MAVCYQNDLVDGAGATHSVMELVDLKFQNFLVTEIWLSQICRFQEAKYILEEGFKEVR